MTENSFNTYEFIINDDDEIMLLLYSQEGSPDKPVLDVMLEENKAVLYRSKDKGIIIEDISDDVLDMLSDIDKILVGELSAEDNEDDALLTNAYEATINLL